MKTRELDPRLDILNTLLTTPHRQLTPLWPIHQELCARDPRFYVRLAAWYFDKGEVRDHKEMFLITLALSAFEGHRDVGLALLRRLPPYQVARVVDFIHGRKVKATTPVKQRQKAVGDSPVATATQNVGLFRALPRSLRTEVVRYLREREARAEWFDRSVLTARKAVKRLYALLHVRPGERAQQVLFADQPPADSRLFALRQLARATDPAEQAAAIVRHRIPYRVAASVVRAMTPQVVTALVETMTPMELINGVAALKQRGHLADPEVQALVERKLTEARSDERVSAYKAEVALEAADAGEELAGALREVTDARLRARGTITRPTALLLDRSGSMTAAIEVGKQLGAMISAVSSAGVHCYVFDTVAREVAPRGPRLADWEDALRGVCPGGGTAIGAGLDALTAARQYVEQIVLVTDEDENTSPLFADAYDRYVAALKVRPAVVLLRIGQAINRIENVCKTKGIPVSVFRFEGDYYSLPNVLPLLAQASGTDLLMEILEYPLPVRKVS